MMYKVSTVEKKNVVEKESFTKDGKFAIIKQGYRWGYFTTDEKPDLENYNPEEGLMIYDYNVEDHSFDDGCWIEFEYDDELTEEEQEEFENAFNEGWYEGVEGLGWEQDEGEVWFHGDLEVEEVIEDDGVEDHERD